ncbi:HAMP domain-containing sensor histidine kinase [Aggregatilineales bacterium SYSU G02658]
MAATTITNSDFVTEVKVDRLKTMNQVTFVAAFVVLMLVLTFGVTRALSQDGAVGIAIGCVVLMAGTALSRFVLKQNYVDTASWVYALSGMATVAVLIAFGDQTALQTLVFVYPVIVFVVGLLISPTSTIGALILSIVLTFAVPSVKQGQFVATPHQGFAVFVMLLAAAFAAQVSGELYQVAEWALANYKRERKMNDELFQKRQELTLSLKRSEVLSENLMHANAELEAAKRAAEEAKNFRGQFLANMSHELRTPLNAIIGFSETMLQFPIMYDDEKLPPAYERDLSQIYSSGRQLLHVINDILDLAKVDAGKLEVSMSAVDPLPLMLAAMSTTKGLLANKPVILEKDLPEDLPRVWADETRLRQVLLNLYSNAAKYTDKGSIKLIARVEGNELIVAVKDTGIGIDPEYHDKLFKEFQQAKAGGRDARSGSGLGLAISKQLLDLMGGRIWMESAVGVGSTFYFALPVYREQDRQPIRTDQPVTAVGV